MSSTTGPAAAAFPAAAGPSGHDLGKRPAAEDLRLCHKHPTPAVGRPGPGLQGEVLPPDDGGSRAGVAHAVVVGLLPGGRHCPGELGATAGGGPWQNDVSLSGTPRQTLEGWALGIRLLLTATFATALTVGLVKDEPVAASPAGGAPAAAGDGSACPIDSDTGRRCLR